MSDQQKLSMPWMREEKPPDEVLPKVVSQRLQQAANVIRSVLYFLNVFAAQAMPKPQLNHVKLGHEVSNASESTTASHQQKLVYSLHLSHVSSKWTEISHDDDDSLGGIRQAHNDPATSF